MSVVREPRSEQADPFGDLELFPPPAAPERVVDTVPDDPVYEPAGGDFGEVVANAAGYGIAKLIIWGVIFLASTFGFRFFGGLGNDGPPNVPMHITEACEQAFVANGGIGSIGAVASYDQSGGNTRVEYESVTGEINTCVYDPFSGVAAFG